MIDTKDARKKYNTQKSNAKRRSIEFCITFDEWLEIWEASGKWALRGRGADKYCMCRIGDTGAYSVENVFIGQGKQNVRDGNLGKLDSEETKRKKSEAAKGKKHPWAKGKNNVMHRPEVKAKKSEATGGANHYKARGVITPEGFFATAKLAAEALGMKKSTVEWRAANNKFGFARPAIA